MEGMGRRTFFEKGRAQRRSVSGPDRETSWSDRGREFGLYRAGGRRFSGKTTQKRPTTPRAHHPRQTSWPSQAGQRPAGKKILDFGNFRPEQDQLATF